MKMSIWKNKNKMWMFPLFFLALFFAASAAVMLLWNFILPTIFVGVGFLNFPKAMGLLVLCRLLFGGFRGPSNRGKHHRNQWKEKFQNMSDEEKNQFKNEWRNRCVSR